MDKGIRFFVLIVASVFLKIQIGRATANRAEQRGPILLQEPPHRVDFSNNTGTEIKCTADGNPPPLVTWTTRDGIPLIDVPGLRRSRPDGTLVFSSFRADHHRQEVHGAVYRCIATNSVGVVGSREVHVRGVIHQHYVPQVYDDFVARGSTAVLKCHVPSFIQDYVQVEAWIKDDGETYSPGMIKDNHIALQTGELIINDVGSADFDDKRVYRCRTRQILSGETVVSATSGKIVITDHHVSAPPRITFSRPYVRAAAGSTAELVCAGQGNPTPTYIWMKEEPGRLAPIRNNDRMLQNQGVLLIRNSAAEDAGKYVCVVRNSIGERREECVLTVTAPLSARVTPQFQVLEMGRPGLFNCTISGFPIHSVNWRQNMKPLAENSRLRLLSSDVLHITTVQREDKGMYQCFVQNDMDSAQGYAEVSLGDVAPSLLSTFTEKIVHPGDFVSLHCLASGNPLPRMTWTLDGTPISQNSRVTQREQITAQGHVISYVNISETRVEDSGQFRCDADNDVGSSIHTARLNVYGPPFVRPMGKTSGVSGADITLQCPVGGYPLQSISWMRGGLVLPVNHRQLVEGSGTLIIKDAQKAADEGEYTCMVKNHLDQEATGTTYVSVVVAPVIDPHPFPESLSVDEGSRARLLCGVLRGDPPIRFKWLKDGVPVTARLGVSVQISEDSSLLTFRKIKFKDSGHYTCIASNGATMVNRTTHITVNVPPKWSVEPSNSSVTMGKSIRLDCLAEGYPTPVISWRKARGLTPGNFTYVYSSSRNQQYSNGTMVIRDVQEIDAGYYLCQAFNGIGTGITKAIFLSVRIPPRFDVNYRSQAVKKNEDVVLKCEAKGESPINIEWQKGKQPMVEKNQPLLSAQDKRYTITMSSSSNSAISELTIANALRQDSALFTCVASNGFGSDETSIQLIVQESPEAPSNLTVSNFTSRTITLQWEIPFNGNSLITRNIVQYRTGAEEDPWDDHTSQLIVPGLETTAILRGLLPVTRYHLRITAENAVGKSPSSDVITVITEEEAPAGPPTEVTVTSTGAQSLKVTWKEPAKDLQHGIIRGYYIGYRATDSGDQFQYKHIEVSENNRDAIQATHLTNLHQLTKYSVVVQAYNKAGPGPRSQEVIGYTLETAPPTSPVLLASSTTTSSVQLRWQRDTKDKSAVQEYVLHYKVEGGDWQQQRIPPDTEHFNLENLRCGTRYRLYMTASNSVGTGEPSNHVTVQTRGAAPLSPQKEHFVTVNSTFAILHLDAWQTGGCPITHYTVQYRSRFQRQWVMVADQQEAHQDTMHLKHMTPGREYTVMVTAHSEAGATQAEYEFQTLLLNPRVIPIEPSLERKGTTQPFHKNLKLLIPVVISAVVIVIVIVIVVVCLRRHLFLGNRQNYDPSRKPYSDDALGMTEFSQKQTPKQEVEDRGSYYSSPTRKPVPVSSSYRKTSRPDNHEYAEPYAAVPPPRRVNNENDTRTALLMQRPASDGFGTISRTPGRPASRASACIPGLDVRYSHQMAPLDKCDYSSGSSHSDGSADKTSSQSSGCRRPYR